MFQDMGKAEKFGVAEEVGWKGQDPLDPNPKVGPTWNPTWKPLNSALAK